MGLILLVRHGQASFGAADYDVLSERGVEQSACLGRYLAGRGCSPATVITGSLRRQRQTAEAAAEAAAWPTQPAEDRSWDEFDHESLVTAALGGAPGVEHPTDAQEYQRVLEAGMRLAHLEEGAPAAQDGAESFAAFDARVRQGLATVAATTPSGGTAVVFTSAGAISWAATVLIGGGVEQWVALNRVYANTGVTTLVNGRRGLSLLTFNAHEHLRPEDVTYR